MASIRKYRTRGGEERYAVVWRDSAGKSRWRSCGRRKKDADKVRLDIERRLMLGPLYEAPPLLLSEWLDTWLEEYELRRRPSSAKRKKEARSVLKPLEDRYLEELRADDVADVVREKSRQAPRQAELALQLLKQALREARKRGQVVDEGVLELSLGGSSDDEKRSPRFLTWSEVEKLASLAVPPWGNLIVFASLSGMRLGELFGLREQHVDLEAGSLRVMATATDGELGPPKSRASRRTVELGELARQVYREQLFARPPSTTQGLVFPSPSGLVARDDNFRYRVFGKAVKRAKLEPLVFHDLRHTYASLMIAAGAPVKMLQEQLGHSSAKVTLDVYGHLYPGSFDEVGARLDRLVTKAREEANKQR